MNRYIYNDGGRNRWRMEAGRGRPAPARDCVTRALAIVTGLPYGECWDYVDQCKRDRAESGGQQYTDPDDGAPCACALELGAVYRSAPRSLPTGAVPVEGRVDIYRNPRNGYVYYGTRHFKPTVSQAFRSGFLPRRGKVIMLVRGHAVALVDGVFHDTGPVSNRTRVRGYYEFPGLED